MKRIFVLLIAFCLILAITSCASIKRSIAKYEEPFYFDYAEIIEDMSYVEIVEMTYDKNSDSVQSECLKKLSYEESLSFLSDFCKISYCKRFPFFGGPERPTNGTCFKVWYNYEAEKDAAEYEIFSYSSTSLTWYASCSKEQYNSLISQYLD